MNKFKWGIVAKLLYKGFRPYLVKVTEDSSNTLDNAVVTVLDTVFGVTHGKGK